jgi:phage gp29-like protein
MPLYLDSKDDRGMRMKQPARPITRTVFTSRPKDREKEFTKKWKPEDLARVLREAEEGNLSGQNDLMEQMLEKDGELAGHAATRTLAPAKLKWAIIPRNDTPEAEEVAARVKEIVEAIPNMRGVLLKMADGILKGISALEIDWRDDKTISGIRWIHAKRYRFDWQSDTFMIVPDDPAQEWQPIPIPRDEFKFIVHKPQLRATHPARGGVLRTLVHAYLFRNYTLSDWVIFSEIYGMPLRLAKYPPGTKDAEKEQLHEAMQMLASDAYAIIDSRIVMEYVDAVNRGIHPGEAIYNAMGRQYQISLLGQDQTSTHNESGGRTQVEFGGAPIRQDLIEADCQDIMETLGTDLLYPITGWHFDWGTADRLTPIFKIYFEPPKDFKGLSEVDDKVHLELGLPTTWGAIAERYGRELPDGIAPETIVFFNEYVPPGFENKPHVCVTKKGITGMSTQQREAQKKAQEAERAALAAGGGGEDEEDAGTPPKGQRRGLRGMPGGRAEQSMLAAFTMLAAQQGTLGGTDPEQAELDARTAALVPRAAAAMRELASPVLSIIASSQSLEEIVQRLSVIYPELDEAGIERLLQRAWYVSRLFGVAVAEFRTGGPRGDNEE